jgi:plasmid stabilization system protein ParE
MKKNIIISPKAKRDIAELKIYIKQELKMPETAANYIKDLKVTIGKLSYYANSVGKNEYVQKMFGIDARHITFKKMAIYLIDGEYIYIRRIIPSALIY